jgi:hypothetical protein
MGVDPRHRFIKVMGTRFLTSRKKSYKCREKIGNPVVYQIRIGHIICFVFSIIYMYEYVCRCLQIDTSISSLFPLGKPESNVTAVLQSISSDQISVSKGHSMQNTLCAHTQQQQQQQKLQS